MTVLIQGMPYTVNTELRDTACLYPFGRNQTGMATDLDGLRWQVSIIEIGGASNRIHLQANRINAIISENINSANYLMQDIQLFRLADNVEKPDEENGGDYVPCVACIMETRTPMPASYRIVFGDDKQHCYCNKHANEISLRCIVNGDTVKIGERELAPILPYDIPANIEQHKRIWRVGHEAAMKRQRERLMSPPATTNNEPKTERAPRKKKEAEQTNFEWL